MRERAISTTILENRDIVWTVEAEASGQRLDRYLAKRLIHRSRASLHGLILEGAVAVKSAPPGLSVPARVKPSTQVMGGMVLLLRQSARPPSPTETLAPPNPMGVLWEDDHVIAVNKPPGMLVHPAGTLYHGTLIVLLEALTRAEGGTARLHLGHRLDKETSGVVVVGRGDAANRVIKAAFKAREIRKGYLAIVHGAPTWDTARSDAPMEQGPPGQLVRLRQILSPTGAAASTQFTVIARAPDHALIACHPHTGRPHQIRLHLEGLGHPILGDKIYGTDGRPFVRFQEEGPSPELHADLGHWRHALHAHWIALNHPDTGAPIAFSAPLAPDLRRLWAALSGEVPPLGWPEPPLVFMGGLKG